MIKCNVTVCGVIGRDASIRTNKEGKTFLVFPLRVMIPDTDGKTMPIEVDVSKDTAGKEVSKYRNGSRIEVSGTMYLKHRGDKLYFNLFINEIRTATADAKDTVKGELVFRGKVGQLFSSSFNSIFGKRERLTAINMTNRIKANTQ